MQFMFDPIAMNGRTVDVGVKLAASSEYPGFYHWHQICELLFVHEGEGYVIVNRQTYALRRGMLFFFQPFQLHRVYANVSESKPYVRTIMHFDPVPMAERMRAFPELGELLERLWKGREELCAFDLSAEAEHYEWACVKYGAAVAAGRGERDGELLLLFARLLDGIGESCDAFGRQRTLAELSNGAEAARPDSVRTLRYSERIMQWIEEHYEQEIGLEDIAAALHLSKFYVSRLFREETGGSVTDYLTARRIKQACRLLRTTSDSVERIGARVGWANASYFIRLFKRVVGTTPLQYRKQG